MLLETPRGRPSRDRVSCPAVPLGLLPRGHGLDDGSILLTSVLVKVLGQKSLSSRSSAQDGAVLEALQATQTAQGGLDNAQGLQLDG